jgi:hypothetical protein
MQATRNEENWSAADKTLNGKKLSSSWCLWCMCVCMYKDPWIICISFIHMSNTFKYCIYDYCITSYKYVEFISWPHCAPYIYIQVISSIIFHGVWCAYVHPTKAAKTKSFSTQQSSAVHNHTAAASFSTPSVQYNPSRFKHCHQSMHLMTWAWREQDCQDMDCCRLLRWRLLGEHVRLSKMSMQYSCVHMCYSRRHQLVQADVLTMWLCGKSLFLVNSTVSRQAPGRRLQVRWRSQSTSALPRQG